jgi:16S rRNA (cytosine967-C5)-methyltransferase
LHQASTVSTAALNTSARNQSGPSLPQGVPDFKVPTRLDSALAVVQAALEGRDAERVLARSLRGLDGPERAWVASHGLATACLHRRLGCFVRAAGLPEDARHLLLAALVVHARLAPAASAAAVDLPEAAALALAAVVPTWSSDPVRGLAEQASLPDALARLWVSELGLAEATALARASNVAGPTTLRANTLRLSRDALLDKLAAEGIQTTPTALSPHGLQVVGRANLFGSAAWRAGEFEVQDEGSQRIAEACRARPGERWLDLCAGAGGKTLALAAAMEDRGEVVACDVDPKRLDNLRARLARAGVTCVRVAQLDPAANGADVPAGPYDGALADVPCSELGTLRRHPSLRWRLDWAAFDLLPALQARLLQTALDRLGRRGRAVYATCTWRRAENEEVLRKIGLEWSVGHLGPHRQGTDGFFVAASEGPALGPG